MASADPDDFRAHRTHTTIFFSALILECLRNVPNTQVIRRNLANFLLDNRSSDWTWNYWIRTSPEASSQPYPDDLDDTACALAALHSYQSTILNGSALGTISQVLISAEDKPGGPYHTWIINRQALPVWQDIDLAVNSNIGYFLSLQSVSVPGLTDYLTACLDSDTLASKYYIGEIPIIYFVSRWYRGAGIDILKSKTCQYLAQYSELNGLMLAMIISSASRLGVSSLLLKPAVERLESLRVDDCWPAHALYGEPAVEGVAYFAGSAALTTAFALEALFGQQTTSSHTTTPIDANLEAVLQAIESELPKSDLRAEYHRQVQSILEHDSDRQICGLASLTATICGGDSKNPAISHLNAASLHGWLAYTIYDNIWDGQPTPLQLGVANFALRQIAHQFRLALPDDTDFQQQVSHVLNIVDAANTWENQHAKATAKRQNITIKVLPDYSDRSQLAARSWGHTLAASGVLCAAGYTIDSTTQRNLRRFFRHYLIARQLNDDAHDWEEDLRNGQVSSVVVMLWPADTMTINLSQDLERLRLQFWQQTIDEVVVLIKQHTRLARQALSRLPFSDTYSYESWLQSLEAAADRALQERDKARDFIASYSGK
jgi:hypothetical protein